MDPNRNVAVCLQVEILEDRVTPTVLTITPVGLPSGDQYIVFVPAAAEAGLTHAAAQSPVVHVDGRLPT